MERFRHLLRDDDLSVKEQSIVVKLGLNFSKNKQLASDALKENSIGLLFEKQSLRTRVSAEVAVANMGAHPVQLRGDELHFNRGEPASDAVRVLSGYLQLLMGRVNSHALLEELRESDRLSIVNGLSDQFHPLQALADLLTMSQLWESELKGKTVCYVGDGNNVCASLMLASAMQGINFRAACPKGLEPEAKVVSDAQKLASANGGSISVVSDPMQGAEKADLLYTDVWVSMGEESGAEAHKKRLEGFQINSELTSLASKDVKILHCLPAHRGEEISAEVIDGPHSYVIQQAHNRLPATMAAFLFLLKPELAEELSKS